MNPRLRAAITAARQENMPKDNIERAIKKAIGNDGENYDEIRYEGYGPGGVAVIVEALTDNRNRAASDIRSYFTKSGGNLGETGSVSFMFDRVGVIEYDAKSRPTTPCWKRRSRPAPTTSCPARTAMSLRLAGDVSRCSQGAGGEIRRAAQGGADLEAAEHHRGRRRDRRKAVEAARSANEHDDVQNVYANFEVSDALMAKMGA